MKKEISITVKEDSALMALLQQEMPGAGRNYIKALLKYGAVRIDGRVEKRFDAAVPAGATILVRQAKPAGQTFLESEKAPRILFEDERLLAIDKPAGLLSISTTQERERTAYHIMTDYVRAAKSAARLYVVHRLDRDTSGVLLFAKDEEMKHALQDRWSELVQLRLYAAVVEGMPPDDAGRVESYLKENSVHLVYSSPKPGVGDHAITDYRLLKERKGYSVLLLALQTGRKNQIRVHMKDLGCPVAGDKKYGAKTNPCGRLALHAAELALTHPFTGEALSFSCPVPKVLLRGFPRYEPELWWERAED